MENNTREKFSKNPSGNAAYLVMFPFYYKHFCRALKPSSDQMAVTTCLHKQQEATVCGAHFTCVIGPK
jgi:hypothetical protein